MCDGDRQGKVQERETTRSSFRIFKNHVLSVRAITFSVEHRQATRMSEPGIVEEKGK